MSMGIRWPNNRDHNEFINLIFQKLGHNLLSSESKLKQISRVTDEKSNGKEISKKVLWGFFFYEIIKVSSLVQ